MDIDRLRALAGTPVREASPRRGEVGAMSPEEISEYMSELVLAMDEVAQKLTNIAPELGLDTHELNSILNDFNRLNQELSSI